MLVYRIDRIDRKDTLLSGIGAEKVGGRWNLPGTRAVYTSEHISLAYLEVVMHLDITEDLPNNRILASIEIPKKIKIHEVGDLREGWRDFPCSGASQEIFTRFVNQNKGVILRVPSVIVPSEYNFIINPLHSDYHKIKVVKTQPFLFDNRLKTEN